MAELETVLKKFANLRSAGEDDIVIKVIKHADAPFKEIVLQFSNQILMDENFVKSLHVAIIQMTSKDGDLAELIN